MKRIITFFLILVLMIILFIPICLADEEDVSNEEQTSQETVQEIQSNTIYETVINTYGKVVETNGIKEVVEGSNEDQFQEITIEIIKGDYIGEEYDVEYALSYDTTGKMLARELEIGDKVEVQITEDQDGNVTATVTDVSRTNNLIWLFILFLISIIIVSGKKGIKTIISLLATIAVIYFFMMKKIYTGSNGIGLAIITAIIVSFITYFIILGINRKAFSAILGTIGGIVIAGVLGVIFSYTAKMTGPYESAIQFSVNMTTVKFNFVDLLYAGIIISALGACMDVAMLITVHLYDIKMSDSEIEWKELFIKGTKYGKEIIGTEVNTLILAFGGCALSLFILFMACDMNISDILSKEVIAEYIVAALSGSIGVLYTVPLTSIIFALLNKNKVIYKRVTDSKVDGKRSLKL